jgi:hypothetical protein
MEKTEHREVVAKIPWLTVILTSVIVTCFLSLHNTFISQPWQSGSNPGPSGFGFMFITMPYAVMVLFLILERLGITRSISGRTLAIIYIATLMSSIFPTYKGWSCHFFGTSHVRTEDQDLFGWAVPYVWMPSADAIRSIYFPGSINALFTYGNEWSATIIWWILVNIVGGSHLLAWTFLLRRQWVDVEELPFPHARGWVIGMVASKETDGVKTKIVLGAALISILLMVPFMALLLYPPLPDLWGWLKGAFFITWAPGSFQIQNAYPILSSTIVGPIWVQTNWIYYALMILAPTDFLLSCTVAYVVFMLLIPQILYYFGYYSGLLAVVGGWGKLSAILHDEPLKLGAVSFGMSIGVFLFYIAFRVRYLGDTLKAAFGKIGSVSSSSSISIEEAKLYKMAWIILPVTFIIMLIMWMYSGLSFPAALLLQITIIMGVLVFVRSRSYGGASGTDIRSNFMNKILWGPEIQAAPNMTPEQVVSGGLGSWILIGADEFGYYAPPSAMMDSFYVAKMAKIGSFDTAKIGLICLILSAVITIPLQVLMWAAWGFMTIPHSKEWDFWNQGNAPSYNVQPATWPWIPQFIVGILAAIALGYLRSRFLWFPLEPLGFIWVWTWWGPGFTAGNGCLTPIIALIIKLIILKVGGRKLYEEYAIPAAVGLLAGYCIGGFLIAICSIYRYFFPY